MRRTFLLLSILMGTNATAQVISHPKPRLHMKTVMQPAARTEDASVVRSIVSGVAGGWASGDAKAACSPYSQDAEWINAFGIERKGHDEICAFIGKVIRNKSRLAVHTTESEIRSVRFLGKNAAVVHAYGESEGQMTSDGLHPIGTRKTHWLLVLQKLKGQWLIVSHLVMDERDRI